MPLGAERHAGTRATARSARADRRDPDRLVGRRRPERPRHGAYRQGRARHRPETAQIQIAADEPTSRSTRSTCSSRTRGSRPTRARRPAASRSRRTSGRSPPGLRRGEEGAIDLAAEASACPANTSSRATEQSSARPTPSKQATYGELIGGQRFNLKIGEGAAEEAVQLKIVGKSIATSTSRTRSTASRSTSRTSRCRGCCTAGSSAAGDQRDARQRRRVPEADPDLVKVVVQKDFVGVVARSEIGAIRAAETMKVTWNDPGGAPKSHDELYAQIWAAARVVTPARELRQRRQGLGGRGKTLEATYYYPYQLHGSMGPVLRDRRREGRRGDGLVADPGHLSAATAVASCSASGSSRCTRSTRRAPAARAQRRRHRLDRRGAAVEGCRAPVRVQWMRSTSTSGSTTGRR